MRWSKCRDRDPEVPTTMMEGDIMRGSVEADYQCIYLGGHQVTEASEAARRGKFATNKTIE